MFDLFSGQHILILLAVLLIVVGPKDLPRLMRIIGQWAGKARAMASEFKKSFDDMARQEELDKLRTELEELRKTNLSVAEDAQRVAEADLVPSEPRQGEFTVTDSSASSPAASSPPPSSSEVAHNPPEAAPSTPAGAPTP